VALDPDLAGVAPIYRGRLQPVGQIGSLVRIPQGLVDLIATVSLVGIAELAGPLAPAEMVQHDERWLQVQLLGEIDRALAGFSVAWVRIQALMIRCISRRPINWRQYSHSRTTNTYA